jgi:hypothetical protein
MPGSLTFSLNSLYVSSVRNSERVTAWAVCETASTIRHAASQETRVIVVRKWVEVERGLVAEDETGETGMRNGQTHSEAGGLD